MLLLGVHRSIGAGLPNKSLADKDDSCRWWSELFVGGGLVGGEAEKKALASMVGCVFEPALFAHWRFLSVCVCIGFLHVCSKFGF